MQTHAGTFRYFVDGLPGAALTLIAIALPPLLVLVLVHGLYRRIGHHPATHGFVRGLALAVAGVFVVVLTGDVGKDLESRAKTW